jgi:hypothetical protein
VRVTTLARGTTDKNRWDPISFTRGSPGGEAGRLAAGLSASVPEAKSPALYATQRITVAFNATNLPRGSALSRQRAERPRIDQPIFSPCGILLIITSGTVTTLPELK